MRICLGRKRVACQQTHSSAAWRGGQLAVYQRWLFIVGLCIWVPVAAAQHPRQPRLLPPAVHTESQPVYWSEPLAASVALTAYPSSVAHPGALRPFSDALSLFLRVEPGETLSAIGKRYGVKVQALVHYNQLQDSNRIRAGDTLIIPLSRLPLVWPVAGIISSQFGKRRLRFHAGIDIAAPRGTPVRAAADGRVMISGIQRGYGRVIWLRHTGGYITVYAHHEANHVTRGQRVSQGQEIAQVGVSGRTTGPHLHFEVHDAIAAQDPLLYLPPEQLVSSGPVISQ